MTWTECPGEVTWVPPESITVLTNTGNGVFKNQTGYRADPCLGYQLMLFWNKRGTLWIL